LEELRRPFWDALFSGARGWALRAAKGKMKDERRTKQGQGREPGEAPATDNGAHQTVPAKNRSYMPSLAHKIGQEPVSFSSVHVTLINVQALSSSVPTVGRY